MSAKKSKSPEAAQHKVWRQELRTLQSSRKSVAKLYRNQANPKVAALVKARRELTALERSTERELARLEKAEGRHAKELDSRIAILLGRLGL